MYRDKSNPQYAKDAITFTKAALEFDFTRVLIHDDIDLASKLGVGVHLSSLRIDTIPKAKANSIFTIASTHSIEEASKAAKLGADMVTLSPIYPSPNKGKPLGIEYLKLAVTTLDIDVIALGGILTQAHIDEVARCGTVGFASIRYLAP